MGAGVLVDAAGEADEAIEGFHARVGGAGDGWFVLAFEQEGGDLFTWDLAVEMVVPVVRHLVVEAAGVPAVEAVVEGVVDVVEERFEVGRVSHHGFGGEVGRLV